ncbi:hypothetical protein OEZ85_007929 [Tetradesmus obliquus]|uniref:Uncharacterized protein n=1 Tax=Tetradesmus obliquus TaxID=3088 RepID=A0ABY8THX0_TETOB|nr:hypothetical protein OEZ85_007929 [Tetradesmus obliquus]
MKEVLDRKLPQELQPALRRSYVCAIWLLQRSRQFRWNTNKMHKPALAGFTRLFEAHLDAAVGRPISFHHISKSGGTSMCQLARFNGCQGPLMTRADNCLLNKGMDGPIWVMKHDPLVDNGIPPPPPPAPPAPPPPPPPPLSDIFKDDEPEPAHAAAGGGRRAGGDHTARSVNDDGDSRWGDDDDDDDQPSWNHPGAPDETASLFMDAAAKSAGTLEPAPVEAMQWFMYDCNSMPKDKEGYGCGERQEAATAKSATFFANEHTLSFQHGEPQVCSAFTNLVMVREPLSEAVSLMSEVIQVYDRLLRRLSVQVWSPPRSDLVWWQRWAPVVVSSYATRTLLGPPAFCPPKEPNANVPGSAAAAAAAGAAQRPQLVMLASGGAVMLPAGYVNPAVKWGEAWLYLSDDQVASALESLYAFDVVLELGSSELIDVSTSKLLGWDKESFSRQEPQRGVVAARALTWQELQQLATQTPPATSIPPPGAAAAAAAAAAKKAGQHQHSSASRSAQGKDGRGALDVDVAKRMLAEAWVRRAYADVGVEYVITPLLPGHKLQQGPPSRAIAVADRNG